jgi:hypothetical protein
MGKLEAVYVGSGTDGELPAGDEEAIFSSPH